MLPEVGEKRYNQRVMKPNPDREVFNLRVIAVFASTVNGKIALSHDDRSEWTSSEDKKYFKSLTSRIGVVIMGRKTHEAIGRPLSGRLNIVLTRHPERYRNSRELLFTSTTLLELLEELEKRGFKEVCLIGGAETFDQFANQGLINELHITFEPILSKGIKGLGENLSRKMEMKLRESRQLGEATLMVYDVK